MRCTCTNEGGLRFSHLVAQGVFARTPLQYECHAFGNAITWFLCSRTHWFWQQCCLFDWSCWWEQCTLCCSNSSIVRGGGQAHQPQRGRYLGVPWCVVAHTHTHVVRKHTCRKTHTTWLMCTCVCVCVHKIRVTKHTIIQHAHVVYIYSIHTHTCMYIYIYTQHIHTYIPHTNTGGVHY